MVIVKQWKHEIRPPSYCSVDVQPALVRAARAWFCIRIETCLIFQELEDSFNYGLFQPPLNGRAGKFLDEERRLAEYPFQGSVGHLEVFDLQFCPQNWLLFYLRWI